MVDGQFIRWQEGKYRNAIIELLGLCMGNSHRIEQIYIQYAAGHSLRLYGWVQADQLVGIMGIHVHSDVLHEISHLAVMLDYQQAGIGRQMIQTYHSEHSSIQLFAETDREAVGFYRQSGFAIYSLGEKYPGVERFRCVRSVDS